MSALLPARYPFRSGPVSGPAHGSVSRMAVLLSCAQERGHNGCAGLLYAAHGLASLPATAAPAPAVPSGPPQDRVSPGKGTTAARARRAVLPTLCPDLRRSLPRVLLLRSRHAGTTSNMHSLLAARRRVPAVSLRILPSPLPAHRPTAQEGTFLAYMQNAVNVVHGFQGSDTRQQLLPLLPFGPDGVGSAAAARPFVTLAGKRCCVKIMPHSPPQPDRAVSGTAYYGRACCGSARLGSSRRHQGSQGSARCGCGGCAALRSNNSQRNYFQKNCFE